MNKYDNGTLYRISRTEAKKRFSAGKHVIMLPCNANPESPWFKPWYHDRADNHDWIMKDDPVSLSNAFESILASFEYYNCQHAETGRYAAFYVDRSFEKEV